MSSVLDVHGLIAESCLKDLVNDGLMAGLRCTVMQIGFVEQCTLAYTAIANMGLYLQNRAALLRSGWLRLSALHFNAPDADLRLAVTKCLYSIR